MDDLIEALTIFRKYGNHKYPTHCEHDVLYIVDINPDDVSEEDTEKLEKLGFGISDGIFRSYHFGSA